MNGNLIPEKRADKRGNLVTRWVRMFGGSNDSAKDLPSPAISKKTSRKLSPEQQSALIEKLSTGSKDDTTLAANVSYLADKDPELLGLINSAVNEGDDIDAKFWSSNVGRDQLVAYVSDPASKVRELRESLSVFPLMREIAAGGGMDIESNEPYDVIYTVHETMKTARIRGDYEETIVAVAAVVYVKKAYVWKNDITTPEYKDIRDDVEYVKDHIENVGRILPELQKRNTLDRDIVESLLSNPAQALSEGEL
jgi:hypothetical protein